jgi:hypothetical protein
VNARLGLLVTVPVHVKLAMIDACVQIFPTLSGYLRAQNKRTNRHIDTDKIKPLVSSHHLTLKRAVLRLKVISAHQ